MDSDPGTENTLNVSQEAKDAKLIINGITAITSSSNTVTSAIPGLTLTLNKEAPGTNVTVKVAADYSEAQKAVQAFVDQYNSVMAFIQEKLKYDKDTLTLKGICLPTRSCRVSKAGSGAWWRGPH
ncbi:MAG: flagellar filament capping protein FliD [Desulfitobacteriia bacterium]